MKTFDDLANALVGITFCVASVSLLIAILGGFV